jgi:uncharacterized membrane protein YbhN (UPF0104 family)
MTAIQAHLICLGLVALDFLVRAWRIQWIVVGLGHSMTVKDAFILNAFGDAACALTPLRIGGEPARLAGMLRSRVPAPAAFVAISLEVLAGWPVLIVAGVWLAWRYAPDWWSSAGPHLLAAGERAWPWVALVAVVSVILWIYARRVTSPVSRQLRRPVRRALVYWRRMPTWPLVASIPLSFVNVAARVAILPVLALTLPEPPALGLITVGSFALLYSQLILPTPSGAGAVELGFLGGAAGDLGGHEGWLLLVWRIYTNGIGVLLGVWLAAHIYGWPALRHLVQRSAETTGAAGTS